MKNKILSFINGAIYLVCGLGVTLVVIVCGYVIPIYTIKYIFNI